MSDIFIAYDQHGKPTGIVHAKSEELALVFWQGKGIYVYSHKCLSKDFNSLDNHPTGVIPLLNTEEVVIQKYDINRELKFNKII